MLAAALLAGGCGSGEAKGGGAIPRDSAVAVAAVAFLPGLVRRVGEDLAADQGLTVRSPRAADPEAG